MIKDLQTKIETWNGESVSELASWLEELEAEVNARDSDESITSYIDPSDWGFHHDDVAALLERAQLEDVWACDQRGWLLYGTEGWNVGTLNDYVGMSS